MLALNRAMFKIISKDKPQVVVLERLLIIFQLANALKYDFKHVVEKVLSKDEDYPEEEDCSTG